MATSRYYVLPPESHVGELSGEESTRPKHMGRDDVEGYGSALAPPPASYDGPTNGDGEVFFTHVHAETAAHADIKADGESLLVGDMPNADVPPSALAKQLNSKYRPQDLAKLKEIRGDRFREQVRELNPNEWADRMGGGSGAFE